MPQNYPNFAAPYFEERQRSIQQTDKEAAQAAALAESLGYYTPELQQRATQPLGQNPTMGESLFGAPARGLGKLIGNQSLQNVGAAQPFDLGQAPPMPTGVDNDSRAIMKQVAESLGLKLPDRKQVIPGVPSETYGQPRLRTKTERDLERESQDNAWKLLIKNYQTDQERQKINAEIENKQAQSKYYEQLALEAEDKRRRGPTPTEASLLKDSVDAENQYREATGKEPMLYTDMLMIMAKVKKNPTKPAAKAAKVQWFELSQVYGFDGTPQDFDLLLERMKWNPTAVAMGVVYSRDSDIPFRPEFVNDPQALNDFIAKLAIQYADVAKEVNQEQMSLGEDDFLDGPVEIPKELKDSGVTLGELQEFMQEFKVPTLKAAIKMYMDVYKQE